MSIWVLKNELTALSVDAQRFSLGYAKRSA